MYTKSLIPFIILASIMATTKTFAFDPVSSATLVTNSFTSIHRLTELTKSTNKYVDAAKEASEVAEDRMYLAERWKTWAVDIQDYDHANYEDGIDGLNQRVEDTIISREEIEDIYKELHRDQVVLERTIQKRKESSAGDKALEHSYKKQATRKTTKTNVIMRTISQNTGAGVVEQSKGNRISKQQLTSLEKAQVLRVKQEKQRLAEEAERRSAWGEKKKGAVRKNL